jgi:transcriptional regulator with XRE-family HTH domain
MAIRTDAYHVTTAADLGAALKYFRTAAGIAQQAAAEGIGQPHLSSQESGKFGGSLTHAMRLLRIVGCEVVVRPRTKCWLTGWSRPGAWGSSFVVMDLLRTAPDDGVTPVMSARG